jgi:hypothetical protein
MSSADTQPLPRLPRRAMDISEIFIEGCKERGVNPTDALAFGRQGLRATVAPTKLDSGAVLAEGGQAHERSPAISLFAIELAAYLPPHRWCASRNGPQPDHLMPEFASNRILNSSTMPYPPPPPHTHTKYTQACAQRVVSNVRTHPERGGWPATFRSLC